jgi:hypothetical protein
MLDYMIEIEGATPDPWQSGPLDPNGVSDLRQWLIDHLASGDAASEWTEVALVGDVTLPFLWDGSDLWVEQPNKTNANLGPQFFGEGEAPPDNGAFELPPVEVQGRRIMSDELIQQIIDDYNDINVILPIGGGGSGNSAPPPAHLPPLESLSCEDLAFLEQEREGRIERGRSLSISGLSATSDYFRGESAFQGIYDAFARLDESGAYNEGNVIANVWSVFQEMRDPFSLLATSLRSIGIGLGIEYAIISLVEGVYRAQRELDQIREEQASRNGCGG